LKDRPDLAATQLHQSAAEHFANAEARLRYPTVSMMGVAGVLPVHPGSLSGTYAGAGLNISLPFLNGGLFAARRAEAEYRSQAAAKNAGWEFGGAIAGHIVGEFPHAQRIPGREQHRIAPGNTTAMRKPDNNGDARHWILEIHLVDRARQFGGFYERLL